MPISTSEGKNRNPDRIWPPRTVSNASMTEIKNEIKRNCQADTKTLARARVSLMLCLAPTQPKRPVTYSSVSVRMGRRKMLWVGPYSTRRPRYMKAV